VATKSASNRPSLDQQYARGMAHPTRARILSVLSERPASPSELEHPLGIALSNLSYHMRQLQKFGLVEPIKSERVRGAVKTTYRATARMHLTQEDWSRLDKTTRRGISFAAVAETLDRATRAIDGGTFDARLDRHVVNLHLDLDEDGWLEVSQIVVDAQARIESVEQQAANRTPDPAERFRATASLLSYESPPSAG